MDQACTGKETRQIKESNRQVKQQQRPTLIPFKPNRLWVEQGTQQGPLL